MGLKDCIARDIDAVFLNTDDFCDSLTIQIGTTKLNVIGSLQSNSVQNNSGNGQALQENAWTLYIKYPLDINDPTETVARSLLSSSTRLMIDGKSYSVVSVSDEMGMATIQLNSRVGR